MEKSSAGGRRFHRPIINRVFLIGLYALTFYLTPVLSHQSLTEGAQDLGGGSYYFINLFNESFEFKDF